VLLSRHSHLLVGGVFAGEMLKVCKLLHSILEVYNYYYKKEEEHPEEY
jgi:hypothetical protein